MAFLKSITFRWDRAGDRKKYPFNISSLSGINTINTDSNVIFFVGENGTGKSTLLEAVGFKCGFGSKGGGKYNIFDSPDESIGLESIITLSWSLKINTGFLLRAETFFDFADYIDDLANDGYNNKIEVYRRYGGKSLHQQSHGEAFISLFTNRLKGRGLYIMDEPEAALSPQRQLAFLRVIRDLDLSGRAQLLIATHSPIVLAYPGAVIYLFDENGVSRVDYEKTDHYQLTRAFLNNRKVFLNKLFED